MLKETETEGTIGFFVTFLSLVAFPLGEGPGLSLATPMCWGVEMFCRPTKLFSSFFERPAVFVFLERTQGCSSRSHFSKWIFQMIMDRKHKELETLLALYMSLFWT